MTPYMPEELFGRKCKKYGVNVPSLDQFRVFFVLLDHGDKSALLEFFHLVPENELAYWLDTLDEVNGDMLFTPSDFDFSRSVVLSCKSTVETRIILCFSCQYSI